MYPQPHHSWNLRIQLSFDNYSCKRVEALKNLYPFYSTHVCYDDHPNSSWFARWITAPHRRNHRIQTSQLLIEGSKVNDSIETFLSSSSIYKYMPSRLQHYTVQELCDSNLWFWYASSQWELGQAWGWSWSWNWSWGLCASHVPRLAFGCSLRRLFDPPSRRLWNMETWVSLSLKAWRRMWERREKKKVGIR